jgi:hypothetical protein
MMSVPTIQLVYISNVVAPKEFTSNVDVNELGTSCGYRF